MSAPLRGRIVVVVGPTASGKSALAAELGRRLPGEVINADSVQVYRHFDIGSGKPSAAERDACPHHLLDIKDPLDPLDAAAWAEQAQRVIAEVIARSHVPIVCGGTFLWVRALLFGLAAAPGGNEGLRAEHRALVSERGAAALHTRLAEVDPASATRLHENDIVRVSRALEVYELSGTPLSELQAVHGFRTPRYDATLMQVAWPRDAYDVRVAARTQTMLECGFVDEVRNLITLGYGSARAMATVGYKQVAQALADGRADSPELGEEIVRATRVFARRQRTWLRDETVLRIDPAVLSDAEQLDRLANELRAKLAL
jgi:tRNA dimethylallyltransferase